MKSKKTLSIILMLLSTFMLAFAQILYKKGAASLQPDLTAIITNYNIIAGLGLYIIGAVVMTVAMKYNNLSTLYPILALCYIWVNIMASSMLGETMNINKWIGSALIILGVSAIGYGADKT